MKKYHFDKRNHRCRGCRPHHYQRQNRPRSSIKKALAMSQPIFKPKNPMSSFQGWFFWNDEKPDFASTSFWDF
jgi:hypothetical protein